MKIPRIANAVSYIDDELISRANCTDATKKYVWLKWMPIAACFAVVAAAFVIVVPIMLREGDPVPPVENHESFYYESYFYSVNESAFSTYVGGKVIAEDKIGNKIADVSVTAGWKNSAGEWISDTEKLRGEVYVTNGVSDDVAVALKFIDEGEAVTTTHYYVIMNPDADLTVVEDYVILPITPNDPMDETVME